MTKITKTGKQLKISIPKDIILQTGWDENIELTFIPYLEDGPSQRITDETPILLKKIPSKVKND
jgi:hypothetical protein